MKEKLKKNEAITLISLVVTIIVLIILAGISINLILGQDGIINKAKEAKQNMEYAQVEEQQQLNTLYDQMSGKINESLSYDEIAELVKFKKKIASAITDMGVTTEETDSVDTMANNIRSIETINSEWKKIDINYTLKQITSNWSTVGTYEELINCKEMIIRIGSRQGFLINTGDTATYTLYVKNANNTDIDWEFEVSCNVDFISGLVKARQTAKGNSSSYGTINCIYYR